MRLRDVERGYEDFSTRTLREQASRCMDCGIPVVPQRVSARNSFPREDLVRTDRWRERSERLNATKNYQESPAAVDRAIVKARECLGTQPGSEWTIKQSSRDNRNCLR